MERPFCNLLGCNLLAKYKRTLKNGERRYLKICSTHYGRKRKERLLRDRPILKNCECGKEFKTIDKRQKYCNFECYINYIKDRPLKPQKCIYCGFSHPFGLHKHHLRKQKRIILCANCHSILHRFFKSKKVHIMEEANVKGYLDNAYREFSDMGSNLKHSRI